MNVRTFTCYVCGHSYRTQTTQAEMDTEVAERYGESVPADELESVCDGCSDDAFWLHEADPAVDICDPSITVDACLDVIIPEIEANIPTGRTKVWGHVCGAGGVFFSDAPKILEIGCGTGRLTNAVQARYQTAHVFGADINQGFLDIAREAGKRLDEWRYPTYINVASKWYPIFFRNISAVYSMAVFQHLSNDRKHAYIDQVGRALRPGGVFVFQYVEGTHSSRCMYDALIGDVRAWCEAAGLTVRRVQHDLLAPRWTWITATREAK